MTEGNYIEREKSKERKMGWRGWFSSSAGLVLVVFLLVNLVVMASKENGSFGDPEANVKRGNGKQKHKKYSEALMKSILFFEGQRSGPLPSSQRMKWRKDSALDDGKDVGVDLVGGYYDAGDNLKFNFPMAFSVTVLSWGVLEFGKFMGPELVHAKEAIKWGTDYFLKSTSVPDKVFVQVGEPYGDHACWERPEDMDTNRTAYAVDKDHPGSEVAAEIAAALASSSLVFKDSDPQYSDTLLRRAIEVFQFADTYRGSYNDSLGPIVCPFYCDWSGYQDELLWGAAWLYKASNKSKYLNYVIDNVYLLEDDDAKKGTYTIGEFGWDNKHAGVNVLIANELLAMKKNSDIPQSFLSNANQFVCYILPDSPTNSVKYSPGGLLFKSGGSQMQNPAALSFLLLVYATHLNEAKEVVQCGSLTAGPERLISIAKSQADYILGNNPAKMSYMVGFGRKYPQRIHHRGSSLPSVDDHPKCIPCHEGTPYFESKDPNPNALIGAVTGGPDINDKYEDSRSLFVQSEPTTYINAPLVGVFAYFHHHSS